MKSQYCGATIEQRVLRRSRRRRRRLGLKGRDRGEESEKRWRRGEELFHERS
jgi:hypothetical protein